MVQVDFVQRHAHVDLVHHFVEKKLIHVFHGQCRADQAQQKENISNNGYIRNVLAGLNLMFYLVMLIEANFVHENVHMNLQIGAHSINRLMHQAKKVSGVVTQNGTHMIVIAFKELMNYGRVKF